MSTLPRFAVVGHPNKGKSSIVATLAHHDSLAISDLSGTTTHSENYPFLIDNHVIYELFDTPGFQRPRQALSWITAHAKDASQRLAAVREFLDAHQNTRENTNTRFADEVELLEPIVLKGAGIIYVVDGSVPYTPEYEAEMSILQWTGQPRMALINPIQNEDYIREWQQALGQYFSVVKVFNPMTADLEKQISVLSAFAELNEKWKPILSAGIEHIKEKNKQRAEQAVYILVESLVDILNYRESLPLLIDSKKKVIEATVKSSYQLALRLKESTLRQRIEQLYAHSHLTREESKLSTDYPDLFDQDYWFLFGLSRKKVVALAASAGAAAGAVVDVGLGGASLLAGSALGGLLGGAASIALSYQPDKISIKGFRLGGKQVSAGPVVNLSFAFVILGRSLQHLTAVSTRVHADRSTLVLQNDDSVPWINSLSKSQQLKLTRLLQKSTKGLNEKDRHALREIVKVLVKSRADSIDDSIKV